MNGSESADEFSIGCCKAEMKKFTMIGWEKAFRWQTVRKMYN
jgi:hypothetical protein